MNTKEEQQEEQQQQEQENEKVEDISLENYSDCQNEDEDEDNLYSLEISKESYDPFGEDINRKNEELEE